MGSEERTQFSSQKWAREDSNLRRRCQQIYSLPPLATWVHARRVLERAYPVKHHSKHSEMGAGGFEPPNAYARGFTIPALWPLGYTPEFYTLHPKGWIGKKSHLSDSNRGPADYKSAALSTELRWRILLSSVEQIH